MTQGEDTSPSGPNVAAQPSERRATAIDRARWAGGILAAVGVIDGLLMALKRREAPCPDGKYFPEGETDFECYVHPLGMQGIAVIVVSLMLGILVFLTCVIAQSSATRRPVV
jgi:hypothetical protein